MANKIINLLTHYKYSRYPVEEVITRLLELGNFNTKFTEIELAWSGKTGEVYCDNIEYYICKKGKVWYRIDVLEGVDTRKPS